MVDKVMDEETETALRASIATWKQRANGEVIRASAANCALCKRFQNNEGKRDCDGCPVFENSDRRYCRGTPALNYHISEDADKRMTIATLEVNYLSELLPNKDTLEKESDKALIESLKTQRNMLQSEVKNLKVVGKLWRTRYRLLHSRLLEVTKYRETEYERSKLPFHSEALDD